MTHQNTVSGEQQKKALAEQLWLTYFNNALYQKGLITEAQRNRIKNMIDCRCCPPIRNER